jgi:hypothetical protein
LAQSFELLTNILSCRANTVEYKNIKSQLNKSELDALKQLKSKQYLAMQRAKRSQQKLHHDHATTTANSSWTDVDEGRSTASSTQYFSIAQERLPISTPGDEDLPTFDLRKTAHEVDKETMIGALANYAHAVSDAVAEASSHPHDKDRKFHMDIQCAKFENLLHIAEKHGLTDLGTDVKRQKKKRNKKNRNYTAMVEVGSSS